MLFLFLFSASGFFFKTTAKNCELTAIYLFFFFLSIFEFVSSCQRDKANNLFFVLILYLFFAFVYFVGVEKQVKKRKG